MDVSPNAWVTVLHVASAVAWLGVVLAMDLLGSRVRARASTNDAVAYAADYGWLTTRVVLPAAIVLLLSGGWLMQDENLHVRDAWWLGAGIAAWLVAFVGSTLLRGPECARIGRLAAEPGFDEEDVLWRIRRVHLLARGELLLLSVALVVMTARPS